MMSTMDERKAFCARMGWELQRGKNGKPHRIIGANGVVLSGDRRQLPVRLHRRLDGWDGRHPLQACPPFLRS